MADPEFASTRRLHVAPVTLLGDLLALRLRNPSPAVLRDVGDVLGTPLPSAYNTASGSQPRAIWVGVNEWMIVSASTAAIPELQAVSDPTMMLCVNIGPSRSAIEVTGTLARDFLMRGCSLDFHPRVFKSGQTAMTLFAKIPILIDQLDDEPRYRIYFESCLRYYMSRWVSDCVERRLLPDGLHASNAV